MVDEKGILNIVKGYLYNKNKLYTDDFKALFKRYCKSDIIEIIQILKKNNIEIVIKQNKDVKEIRIDNNENVSLNNKNFKSLSNEQLCELYKQGNKKILDIILEKNKNLIWSRVKKFNKFFKHKLDDEDLFQSGAIGLIKAVEKFENNKEVNLTTYSIYWIDQKIRRDIIDYGFTIRIPVHMVDTIMKVNYIIVKNEDLPKEKILEIAEKEGIDKEKFQMALSLRKNILSISSINTLIGEENDAELIDFIEDKKEKLVEDEVVENIEKEAIKLQLETLKEREKDILKLRFGLNDGKDRTLEEIGKIYGVSRERIRQIESKALNKLRHPSRSKKFLY